VRHLTSVNRTDDQLFRLDGHSREPGRALFSEHLVEPRQSSVEHTGVLRRQRRGQDVAGRRYHGHAMQTQLGVEAMSSFQAGMLTLAPDVALSYAEQGNALGPAVVLLHGYSDSWLSFRPLMEFCQAA
jgi:hypothetical protein